MSDLLNDLFDLGDDDINDSVRTQFAKAPFGWMGGKTMSLKHIIPEITKRLSNKWVDIFGGSGVVSWNVPDVEIMVYNDRYSGLVDFYRCLRDAETLRNLLYTLDNLMPPHSREEWLRARASWADTEDPVQRAARWFYMVKNSVISKGQSFGRATNSRPPITLPNALELFTPIHYKVQHFTLENLDWRTCFRDFDSPNAVIYLDPPYIGTDSGCYKHKFTVPDLERLLIMARNAQGTVLLSHYSNDMIDDQGFWDERYSWDVKITADVQAYQAENGKSETTTRNDQAKEYLWIKEAK